MPEENVDYLPRREVLTFEELTRFVRCAVERLGVNKVRITGGEPLVRQNVAEFVRQLKQIDGLKDLALTTNGILLDQFADSLYAAGLRRLNISIDTLDRERFIQYARRDQLDRVIAGIKLAQEKGFGPIKLNAVAIRGLTEADVIPLAEFARETNLEVRFIEYMPLDAERSWERDKVLLAADMRQILAEHFPALEDVTKDPHAPARTWRFADGKGKVGFISSVSEPFCHQCDRFRLTADGKLRNCLFSTAETDVRELLRSGGTDEDLVAKIRECVAAKEQGHAINSAQFLQPLRPMHSIGG